MSKTLNISAQTEKGIHTYIVECSKVDEIAKKLIEKKNAYKEETVIEAKRVIIEEANKEKAMEILQKRLARGEITLEEFHKLVART
jgi:hypothetical protein